MIKRICNFFAGLVIEEKYAGARVLTNEEVAAKCDWATLYPIVRTTGLGYEVSIHDATQSGNPILGYARSGEDALSWWNEERSRRYNLCA